MSVTDHIAASLQVPFYDQLYGYKWAADFNQAVKLQAEIAALTTEKKQAIDAPETNADFLAGLLAEYDAATETRILDLAGGLNRNRQFGGAVLVRLPAGRQHFTGQVSADEIRQAVATLPEPENAMTAAAREKTIAGLEKRLAGLKDRLQAASPPEYFTMKNGQVAHDMRAEFCQHWRQLQGKCSEKIGPMGFPLGQSPAIEQAAHKSLLIGQAVNPAGLAANPRRSDYRIRQWPAATV